MRALILAVDRASASITDWIGSLGTALSLLVISLALTWEMRTRRAERRENEMKQARLVHFVAEAGIDGLIERAVPTRSVVFDIFNDSELPIYDLSIDVRSAPSKGKHRQARIQSVSYPQGWPERLDGHTQVSTTANITFDCSLPARSSWSTDQHEGYIEWPTPMDRKPEQASARVQYGISFTDSQGSRWLRRSRYTAPARDK